MKRPTRKQRKFTEELQAVFRRKKNYAHQRKHNGIAGIPQWLVSKKGEK